MSALANRRRPASYDDVYGNDAQVAVLKELFSKPEDSRPRVVILTGVPGSGKTTLARIVANSIVTDIDTDIMEINGSAQNKKEDAEALVESIQYRPMSGGNRAIIYDEAHATTPAAWSLLLKPLEDGYPHNYWFIATSESKKIPKAILRRAKCIEISSLSDSVMKRLLVRTSKDEGIQLHEEIRNKIIEVSGGSPGQALSCLETVSPLCKKEMTPEEVQEACALLRGSAQGSTDLAKALLAGADVREIISIVKACKEADEDAESLRRGVLGYCSAAILGGWDKGRGPWILEVFCSGNTYDSGIPGLLLMAITAARGE